MRKIYGVVMREHIDCDNKIPANERLHSEIDL